MLSSTQAHRVPQVWRIAILGTIAALPATVVLDWLPNSELTIGGGVLLVGPTIAGIVANELSVDPSAAGLRAGFLGGIITVSIFILTEGTTVAWSLNVIVFFLIAVVMFLCISPVFGLISGQIGGWIANYVADIRADQAL